ncbi:hypothetical protein HYW46_03660 [Candidatus Daviesbacteria bacterium]|nr:hypothetical protein [Candidatus Daviesbacteria bacterium]
MKVYYLPYGVNHPVDTESLAALKAAGIPFSVLEKDGASRVLRNLVGGVALVEGHGAFETGRLIRRIRKAGVPAECLPLKSH